MKIAIFRLRNGSGALELRFSVDFQLKNRVRGTFTGSGPLFAPDPRFRGRGPKNGKTPVFSWKSGKIGVFRGGLCPPFFGQKLAFTVKPGYGQGNGTFSRKNCNFSMKMALFRGVPGFQLGPLFFNFSTHFQLKNGYFFNFSAQFSIENWQIFNFSDPFFQSPGGPSGIDFWTIFQLKIAIFRGPKFNSGPIFRSLFQLPGTLSIGPSGNRFWTLENWFWGRFFNWKSTLGWVTFGLWILASNPVRKVTTFLVGFSIGKGLLGDWDSDWNWNLYPIGFRRPIWVGLSIPRVPIVGSDWTCPPGPLDAWIGLNLGPWIGCFGLWFWNAWRLPAGGGSTPGDVKF